MAKGQYLLSIRFRHNVRAHITWFEWLSTDELFASIKKRYESSKNLRELQRIARQVVETEIYSKNTTDGTGKIKKSVTPYSGGEYDEAGVSVFFNPAVAPAKGPVDSGDLGSMNYAAFFDDPNWNSFLPPGKGLEVFSPKKYRPFSEPLHKAGEDFATIRGMEAIMQSIKSKRPKSQGNET